MTTSCDGDPLFDNFLYDFERFAKYSFISGSKTREHRIALLRILIHSIESGAALPEVRLGYGEDKLKSLSGKLKSYIADYGSDENVHWAIHVFEAYIEFHRVRNHPVPFALQILNELKPLVRGLPEQTTGGTISLSRKAVQNSVDFDFDNFLSHRRSVRQYQHRPVDEETIRRIAANAQQSPNVCNRQTNKLYAFNDHSVIRDILKLHQGSDGFEQDIYTLFIVTSNVEDLNMIGERYQGWIDGGIFAMMLALSIHAEGLGACFLNWSVEKERDQALRKKVGIPDNELVITFMSAGHLKDEFVVSKAQRRPLDEILSINPKIS